MALGVGNSTGFAQAIFESTAAPFIPYPNPTIGSRLVLGFNLGDDSGSAAALSSIASTAGNTWAKLTDGTRSASRAYSASSRRAVEAWTTIVTSGSSNTNITMKFANAVANYFCGYVLMITGASTATNVSVVTTTSAAAGSTNIPITAAAVNPQASMIVLAISGSDSFGATVGASTAKTGYTSVGSWNNASYPSMNFSQKIVSSVETSSAIWDAYDGTGQGLGALLISIAEDIQGQPTTKRFGGVKYAASPGRYSAGSMWRRADLNSIFLPTLA